MDLSKHDARPPVSVVMPVRNALPFLDASVESILGQSFGDFEFLILDDRSDDGSRERLREWAGRDRRIRLVESDVPLGPVRSSQMAVDLSRAPLVARMDADDVADEERLRRQIEVFEAERGAGLVGTLHCLIDGDGTRIRGRELTPLARPMPVLPVTHSSIMFRRTAWRQAGGYRAGSDYWEDVDLYLRMADTAAIFIIPEALSNARFSRSSTRPRAAVGTLEAAYDRMHRRINGRGPSTGRIIPGAFIAAGVPRLWSGMRPHILKGLIAKGELRLNAETAHALLWASAAELVPGPFRSLLNTAARLREKRAPQDLARARWLRWRPMQPCQAGERI